MSDRIVDGLRFRLCDACMAGRHEDCTLQIAEMTCCNCYEPHPDDDAVMLGFKRLKRMSRAELELEVQRLLR